MYVTEAKWYQKQQERKVLGRKIGMVCTILLGLVLMPLCFQVLQVGAMDVQGGRMFMGTMAFGSAEAVGAGLRKEELMQWKTSEVSGYMLGVGVTKDVEAMDRRNEKAEAKTEAETWVEIEKNMGAEAEADIGVETDRDTEFNIGSELEKINGGKSEKLQEVIFTDETDNRYLIVVDAGHGGKDEGCSFENVEEKDVNLYLAKMLQEKLEAMDFKVLLTRSEDTELSLEERTIMANKVRADAFISIHQNFCEEESASGVETYFCGNKSVDSERLARLVEQYVTLYTKARDRGVRQADNLYVIRKTNMPSCLVETGFLSNPEERVLLQDKEYLEKITQGLADAVQLYFYPKVMYLTFDDGPVAGNTDVVLDILKAKGMHATFFVVGKNVERNPELARRIVEEGHGIGIHCYQHDYNVLYESVDSYLADFEKARQVLFEATGVETKMFRFPGGSINSYNRKVYQDIIEEMTDRGYIYYDWNASFEDAVRYISAEQIMQNAKSSTLGRKKVVMLAHDMVDVTVECLEEVLKLFPEYEIKALDETIEPIQF